MNENLKTSNNELDQLEKWLNEKVIQPKSRYSIVFKQFVAYQGRTKFTYNSELNLVNMQEKFKIDLKNDEVKAIKCLVALKRKYWRWCTVYDNEIPDGPDRVVFRFEANKGVVKNQLW